MKKPTIINLDIEVVEALEKQDNRSRFVNDLLKEFFGEGGDLKLKEIELKITEAKKELTEVTERLNTLLANKEKLLEKENAIKAKFINIPKVVLEDFRKFPAMNEESLKNRFNNYWCIYKVTYEEILEAFKEFKNGK